MKKIDTKLSFSPLKLSRRNLGVGGRWIKCPKIPIEISKVLVICGLFAVEGAERGGPRPSTANFATEMLW